MPIESRTVTELSTARFLEASGWSIEQWTAFPDDKWEEGDTTRGWTPLRTLDHLVDAVILYSAYVARRATARIQPPRNGDPSIGASDLVDAFESGVVILATVLDDLTVGKRAFHPSGFADRTGWIGMACTEVLVHTYDATRFVESDSAKLNSLADDVVDRVLPWAPRGFAGFDRLLWATGRSELGDMPPEPPDWWWQSAPLAEWDGAPRRRTSPPQW